MHALKAVVYDAKCSVYDAIEWCRPRKSRLFVTWKVHYAR